MGMSVSSSTAIGPPTHQPTFSVSPISRRTASESTLHSTFKTSAEFGIHYRTIPGVHYDRSPTARLLRRGPAIPGYFNTCVFGAEDLTLQASTRSKLGGSTFGLPVRQNTRGVNGNLNFTGQFRQSAPPPDSVRRFVTGQLQRLWPRAPFYDTTSRLLRTLHSGAWRLSSRLSVNVGPRFDRTSAAQHRRLCRDVQHG